jgi:drug/metabolite transporter (DMT)-like permease
VAVYIFWGGTYLAMKIAIETIPPFLMAGIRFLLAGTIVYAWQSFLGVEKPQLIHWRNSAIIGGTMLLGGNGGVVWAEQFVPSTIAAVFFATVPIWVALLAWLWQGSRRPSGLVFLGLALGIIGMALLVKNSSGELSNPSSQWISYIALVAASLFWAVGALYSRVAKLPSAPLMSIALQMLTGGFFCLLFGLLTGEWTRLDFALVSMRSVLSMGYLIVFGSFIGFSAYIWLLRVVDPILVTTNTYVNPVVAGILGWVLAGERITSQEMLAALIIILSVIIVSIAGNRKTMVTHSEEQIVSVSGGSQHN